MNKADEHQLLLGLFLISILANAVPEIGILGETTEALPTSPERSVEIFHLFYHGTYDRGFDTALKDLGFVHHTDPDGCTRYIKDDVPSEADICFEELPLPEGESPARSNHIKRYLCVGFWTLGSIQEFLEKKAKSVDGLQYKFVVDIMPAYAIFFMPEKDHVPLSDERAVKTMGEEIAQKLKELGMSDAPVVPLIKNPSAAVFSNSYTNTPGVSGIKLSSGADPSLKKLPLPENSKDRYVNRVHDDQLFVAAINTSSTGPDHICIDFPKADVPLDKKFSAGTMEKLAEKCDWVPTEMFKLVGAGLHTSSNANLAGPLWAMQFVAGAKIVGLACTVAAFDMWNHRPELSRVLIKTAAIAVASAIIMSLAMPLPPVVAWPVGLTGWITVVTTVLRN